jgi:hypothetical protein
VKNVREIRMARKKRAKTLQEFIRKHREEIDSYVLNRCPGLRMNDDERRAWVLSDPSDFLYNWARSEGVNI